MKRIFFSLFFLSCLSGFALASEDNIKLLYSPGLTKTDRWIEIILKPALSSHDEVIATVYAKLKEVEATGQLDYFVPDAPAITIEVSYQGQVIKSGNTMTVPKVPGFETYQKLWMEAYALVWSVLEKRFKP